MANREMYPGESPLHYVSEVIFWKRFNNHRVTVSPPNHPEVIEILDLGIEARTVIASDLDPLPVGARIGFRSTGEGTIVFRLMDAKDGYLSFVQENRPGVRLTADYVAAALNDFGDVEILSCVPVAGQPASYGIGGDSYSAKVESVTYTKGHSDECDFPRVVTLEGGKTVHASRTGLVTHNDFLLAPVRYRHYHFGHAEERRDPHY